ncbi:MAG TPA: hypothetical protein VLG66_17220 [Alphaproteobacteria bacterium]|nr:hypothetical protein [Alphaproteobacteria bacterium]
MSNISENFAHDPLNHEYVAAAMRRARVIRSLTFASWANRFWVALKRTAADQPKRIARAARPLSHAIARPAQRTNAARPVTAAELRAVFGGPANTAGPAWRKSA